MEISPFSLLTTKKFNSSTISRYIISSFYLPKEYRTQMTIRLTHKRTHARTLTHTFTIYQMPKNTTYNTEKVVYVNVVKFRPIKQLTHFF